MKVIILAGGFGTRLSEETDLKPKPMVLIDHQPILWHLLNSFSIQGFNEFVLALGYRGDVIKTWLASLGRLDGDVVINTSNGDIQNLNQWNHPTAWTVTALETGLNTQTGGRIMQCMDHFPGERILVTYGDGLANVKVVDLLNFHLSSNCLATVTAVRPPSRFGQLIIENDVVKEFGEKVVKHEDWINGGYFILEPEVRNFIKDDSDSFEFDVLPKLVEIGQLSAYKHNGFWKPMDTLREKNEFVELARLATPPWLGV
jgi:glucose-1-phosphate cytidylyltransferase